MTFLQSTFTALLEVTLDERHGLENVRVVEANRGVYFGLSRGKDRVYCAARNTDVNGNIVNPRLPTSNIIGVDLPFESQMKSSGWAIPSSRGIHQIRCREGLIWIMNCRDPELVAFDPGSGSVVDAVSLAQLVPLDLQHDFPQQHPLDRYHFNSLCFTIDRLFVLAHNWGLGSFALEFDFPGAEQFLHSPRLVHTHVGLGFQAHDIHVEGESLCVLDSANGRILFSFPGAMQTTPTGKFGFARGLAVNSEFLWIGHGSIAKREDRVHGPTHISVIDRKSLQTVSVVEVGNYGNPCDLLLISELDWSDSGF